MLAQQTLAGAGLLDFGDHCRLPGCDFRPQRRLEIARRRLRVGLRPYRMQRLRHFRGGDFLRLGSDDAIENVSHE
jgi:hypothetical protein